MGFPECTEKAGSPSQHLVGLHTLKCRREAREFDSLIVQRKYLCKASILLELWTVIVCQIFHAMDRVYKARLESKGLTVQFCFPSISRTQKLLPQQHFGSVCLRASAESRHLILLTS